MTDQTGPSAADADFYEDLLSSMAGVVFQCVRGADGGIAYPYLSAGLRALCGLEPAAVMADPGLLLGALHRDDRDGFLASLADSAQNAAPWALEFRVVDRQGREKRIEGSAAVQSRDNGEVVWNGLLRELTEGDRPHAHTARQSATIDAIFDNMDQGLVYYDRNLVVVAHNDRALEMLGLPPDVFADNKPFETWLRHATKASGNSSEKSLEERVARRMEIARRFEPYSEDLVRGDGATIEVRGQPTGDGGFVLTYTDVSERKKLEEQLRDRGERLAQQLNKSHTLARTLDRRNKELSESQKASEFLANHDVLTGLPNRRLLLESLAAAVEASDRNGIHLALLFIDLDNFKSINDTHGHDAGDEVLVEASRRLRSGIREGDIVARLGGDEFAVLMASVPHDGRAVVIEIAERLRQSMKISPRIAQGSLATSACIGIAFYPGGAKTHADLLQAADQAMYDAKRGGRDAVVVAA